MTSPVIPSPSLWSRQESDRIHKEAAYPHVGQRQLWQRGHRMDCDGGEEGTEVASSK